MPRFLRYCNRCILPETKPDLKIDDEGVCSACRAFEQRAEVDWDQRREELLEVFERYRKRDGSNYDCIIPVSGGKDSTTQALRLLELGINPLLVTATTDSLSDIGRRNIENLKLQGADYVEVTTNPLVRRKINKLGLEQVGDISWPEHLTIFTIPPRVAVQTNVPLLIWGENPQNEYGGPAAAQGDNTLTRRWLEEFGGLLGLRVSDLVGQAGIEEKDLIQYTYPSDEELRRVGVSGLFLGYYMPWDGYANALFAQAHGFETYPTSVEGSLVNYENLDNHHTGIHDYFKFLKFGFGRVTDHASLHVRRGRFSRPEAVALSRKHDGRFPWTYLGHPIETTLDEIDLTIDQFIQICDRFTNKKLFKTDARGALLKDKDGNLTKHNYDNVDDAEAAAESGTAGERVGAGL